MERHATYDIEANLKDAKIEFDTFVGEELRKTERQQASAK
jgi:hypothetical protein